MYRLEFYITTNTSGCNCLNKELFYETNVKFLMKITIIIFFINPAVYKRKLTVLLCFLFIFDDDLINKAVNMSSRISLQNVKTKKKTSLTF